MFSKPTSLFFISNCSRHDRFHRLVYLVLILFAEGQSENLVLEVYASNEMKEIPLTSGTYYMHLVGCPVRKCLK